MRAFAAPRLAKAALVAAAGVAGYGAACLPDLPAASGSADAGGTTDLGADAAPVCGNGIVERPDEACDPGTGDAGAGTAVGCANCQIDCPEGGIVQPDDHCYFLGAVTSRAEKDIAAACAAASAHVVTISSDDERDAINEWLDDEQMSGFFYVGLMRAADVGGVPVYDTVQANEPGWSSTCSGCYAAPHALDAKSFLDVCDAFKTPAACVVGSPSSAQPENWSGIGCTADCGDAGASALNVCEREPIGSSSVVCDHGAGTCLTIKTSPSTYELVTAKPLDAVDATRACATKHGPSGHPGHLVVFDDAEERESLSRELAVFGATLPSYWVGLSRASATAGFLWADSAAVDAHSLEWGNGQPGAGNYVLAQLGTAFDRQLLQTSDGSAKLAYVCELE